MRVLIKEGCKGFLFKKGKFIKMVGAGVYNTLGGNLMKFVRLIIQQLKLMISAI